jgi:ribonuclease D
VLIIDNKTLEKYCNEASKEKVIAFDTEFMRDRTYYPRLSLVQVASSKATFAVDMTCNLNYKYLADLLANDEILKVIHSSRQDVELLYNFFGFIPRKLFDTQVAAIFLGYKEIPSFETLTFDFLGKRISKKLQFSDWLARPLSEEQLEYALFDASLLYEIYYKIKEKLKQNGRLEWVASESNQILTGEVFRIDHRDIFIKFSYQLTREDELAICYRLVKWREEKAKILDIPRNHLLKEESIIEICRKKPNTLEKLAKISSISKRVKENEQKELISLVDKGVNSDEEQKIINDATNLKKLSVLEKNNLFYMLKILLEITAKEVDMQESFIATTGDLLSLANHKDYKVSRVMNLWRKEVFGNRVLDLLEGKVLLGYKNGGFFIS